MSQALESLPSCFPLYFGVCPKFIGTMNFWKVSTPVTVAKPVWHLRAFPPPNRMCTAPRNLATPVGKSPDPNTAMQQKQTKIATLRAQGASLQEQIAALQKQGRNVG